MVQPQSRFWACKKTPIAACCHDAWRRRQHRCRGCSRRWSHLFVLQFGLSLAMRMAHLFESVQRLMIDGSYQSMQILCEQLAFGSGEPEKFVPAVFAS